MATQKQLQTLDRHVDTIHEMMMTQVMSQSLRHPARQLYLNRQLFVRMFSQLLYEAPKLFTGQVSINMVDRKLHDFKAKPCPEHYLSRQKGGEEIVRMIEDAILCDYEPMRSLVYNIVLTYCAVHYTTPEENATLKRFQRLHHDESAYREAGIVLIPARDLFTKRGHSDSWKEDMIRKYAPIVEHHLTSVGLVKDNQPIEE